MTLVAHEGAEPLAMPGAGHASDASHDQLLRLHWEEPSGHLLEIITRPYGSANER